MGVGWVGMADGFSCPECYEKEKSVDDNEKNSMFKAEAGTQKLETE